jgi:hypothetical protein
MSEAVIPVLTARFNLHLNDLPLCFERWRNCVRACVEHRFANCPESVDLPVTVSCRHISLCITFYPVAHDTPVLIYDGEQTYITSECTLPMIFIHEEDNMDMESANMAITTTASAFATRKRDPSLAELGDPGNLTNYLPDSGATQHMTPHRADLFDEVEGQNLGVEVADGHIIKCSVTGKIQLDMLDDNGNPLNAVLLDVMYIPGLSRRLFSITRFAKHGHFATIKQNSTTLYFGSKHDPVTLPAHDGKTMAADIQVTSTNNSMKETNLVPRSRSNDHSSNSK